MAAKKAGLEKVPVIIKKFESRDETIEYEYKMQLNSRRLTDGEYFAAFLKLDEIRKSNPNAQGNSDEMIGRQLNKSARQVCKMREIAKKADAALLEKIQTGAVSINKAHEMIKAAEAKKKAGEVVEEETASNTGKGINQDSFKLGANEINEMLSQATPEQLEKISTVMKANGYADLGSWMNNTKGWYKQFPKGMQIQKELERKNQGMSW